MKICLQKWIVRFLLRRLYSQPVGEQAAGVVVNLASGRTVYARVDPGLLGRSMEVLAPEELGEVVNAIVDAVENPDKRPLCHAYHEDG